MNRGFGTDYTCQAVTFQNYYKDCYGDVCETSPNCLSGRLFISKSDLLAFICLNLGNEGEKPKYPTVFNIVKGPVTVTGHAHGFLSENYRYWQLNAEGHVPVDLSLEPGQMLGFAGPKLGFRSETDPLKVDRDATSGLASTGSYFVRFELNKPEFVFFTTQCDEAHKNYTAVLKVRI